MRLAIHPDDPPRKLLVLPRAGTAEDVRQIFAAVDNPYNRLTLCAGTFGVRPDNDLPAMAEEFGERIYFSHLEAQNEENRCLFRADHLNSDIDMLGLIENLLTEEARRQTSGEAATNPNHLITAIKCSTSRQSQGKSGLHSDWQT